MKLDSALVVNRTGAELRVAQIRGGEPVSLAVERGGGRGVVGNIYKARVLRVVPGMQSAFVDVGLDRAAFLFGGDVLSPRSEEPPAEAAPPDPPPDAEVGESEDTVVEARIELGEGDWDTEQMIAAGFTPAQLAEGGQAEPGSEGDPRDPESTLRPGTARPRWVSRGGERPRIETLLQPGQELLVQVSKEAMGSKGVRLTTQIALPGRFLVYMPFSDHVGVSRRITEEEERERLRELAESLRSGQEGFIVRTVCEGLDSEELAADAESLRSLWKDIEASLPGRGSPSLIHREADLVVRTVRDLFAANVDRLILDDPGDHARAVDFARRFLPALEERVELYEEAVPIFEVTGVERRIARALGSRVRLPSGGYLVIETTEALTSIDVNSGRYTGGRDLEETTLRVNLEAAKAVVEQLRLRDIGGLIVVDFIDMLEEKNRRKVDEAIASSAAADPARCSILPISEFGLVEMTRRRVREDLARNLLSDCEHCGGSGRLKSAQTVGYEILREIRRNAVGGEGSVRELVVRCESGVARWLVEEEAETLESLSKTLGSPVRVVAETSFPRERFAVSFQVRGRELA